MVFRSEVLFFTTGEKTESEIFGIGCSRRKGGGKQFSFEELIHIGINQLCFQ